LLSLAEFAYNNTIQESTKMSPFFANYGFHPRFLAESRPTSTSSSSSHAAAAAEEFASYLYYIHERLVQNVKYAQDLQARGEGVARNEGNGMDGSATCFVKVGLMNRYQG